MERRWKLGNRETIIKRERDHEIGNRECSALKTRVFLGDGELRVGLEGKRS